MGFDKHDDGIDPYAVQLIKYKARQLVGQAGFTASDRDDLEQELILDLLRRLPKYNPERARRNTFIAGGRAQDRHPHRGAEGRHPGLPALPMFPQRPLRGRGRPLALDLAVVLERLPPELRELCRRFKAESVTEISRDTGVPRGTIYESIKKLREIFEDAGLKDYL